MGRRHRLLVSFLLWRLNAVKHIVTLKIGLTGGIGSGKTFVANTFEQLGANLIDADVISRIVVEPDQPALSDITEHFGQTILNPNGTLDRAELRKRIFEDGSERLWLERLLHPLIRQKIETQLNTPAQHYHLLVSPLLFETGQDTLVSHTILVDVPSDIQLSRTMKRDDSSEADIQRIIDSQMQRKERLRRATYIINNFGSKAVTIAQVEQLHRKLLHL